MDSENANGMFQNENARAGRAEIIGLTHLVCKYVAFLLPSQSSKAPCFKSVGPRFVQMVSESPGFANFQ